MPILQITEHELKEKYGHDNWQEVLQNYFRKSDVFLHYSCTENKSVVSDLIDLASLIDEEFNIIIFEECVEKGGGGEFGLIPALGEYIFRGGVFILGTIAVGFLKGLGEKAYRKIAKAFGKYRSEMKARGSLSITLTKENGNEYIYYYSKSLSAGQSVEGFRAMRKHFLDTKSSLMENRFIYISKLGKWERL